MSELRDVPGFEGLYAVSSDGRVWGYERRWITAGRIQRHRPARWLKLIEQQRRGYLVVNLKKGGQAKTMLVHRLVAQAFVPNPLGLPDVNHRNLRKTDNRAQNLEWCTPGDNKRHSARARRGYGVFVHLAPGIACANDGAAA